MIADNYENQEDMEWSGRDDWRTFRDYHLIDFSEQHQSEELQKVAEY